MELSESKKKITAIFFILIILIFYFYFFIYSKNHVDWKNIKPNIKLSAHELIRQIQNKQENNYINQVIEISGNVTALYDSLYILNNTIVCKPDVIIEDGIVENSFITVKGRFVGYDDLLMEVRLDHVVLIKFY
ncbi:MAG: hypothetical protein CMG74_10025 [Candidatus Marinimicrobia bacterium]|nr:hypothetical protein [Candidatus Neomarinimicrobiota bacterium]|tara:strand:+ start:2317 stop:2715 length:399 start_codon:yes stop_codon:yes gene_type:complete